MPPLNFGGYEFRIAGGCALHWPLRNALIFADLHFEKASWFAKRGQMLPPHDSQATLERIAALVEQSNASEVWCLGDNFHDSDGPARLQPDARALLAKLTRETDWRWITGNHDEALPQGIGGTIMGEAEVAGLILRHRADPGDLRPELSGHFHPKYRATARGKGVSRPCFVASATKLILPAFGALTGGLAASHPEIAAAVGPAAEALMPVGDRVLRFALP
jgi:uncharacterized protein